MQLHEKFKSLLTSSEWDDLKSSEINNMLEPVDGMLALIERQLGMTNGDVKPLGLFRRGVVLHSPQQPEIVSATYKVSNIDINIVVGHDYVEYEVLPPTDEESGFTAQTIIDQMKANGDDENNEGKIRIYDDITENDYFVRMMEYPFIAKYEDHAVLLSLHSRFKSVLNKFKALEEKALSLKINDFR